MKRYIVVTIFIFLVFYSKTALSYEYTAETFLSLSEEYNDNIFLVPSDKTDDFITYISPGVNLSIRSTTGELKLGYFPTFSIYKSRDELNETAHHFTANGNFTLSERLTFSISDTFVKSSEITDIRAVPDLGPIRGRQELRSHNIRGNISYRLKPNLFYILGASFSDNDFKEPGSSEVKTYSGNTGLTYRYSEKTTLNANVRYAKNDFRPESDATDQFYELGMTYRFTQTLTLGLTGSTIITKIEDTDETDTGFGGSVSLTKIFEKGQAVLSYRQTVIPGTQEGEPLRDRTASLSVSRSLTNTLSGSVSASYSNFESIETNNVDITETRFSGDLTYRFRPWANLALSYSYVDSNDKIINTRDYHNNIILFTMRFSYNRRL
ncbi:MAG: hypothetical protein AB1638_01175 [Nitrospirota bacterium]